MGLDQYAYKVSKPNDDILDFMKNRLAYCLPNDIHNFNIADALLNDEIGLIKDLIPYGVITTLYGTNYDSDLIRKDHDIPESAKLVGLACRPDYEEYSYKDENDKLYKIIVSEYDLNHRYEIIEPYQALLVQMDEIHYWREARDVQDLMYENLPVQNCGYYSLDYGIMEQLNEIDPDFKIPELNDSEAVVYHEWY